jgi:hypothetical protein
MEVCNGMLDTRKVGKGLGFNVVLGKGQKRGQAYRRHDKGVRRVLKKQL